MAPTEDLPRLGSYTTDEGFICNYCHCMTPGYPTVLGRSARLACCACAATIVKLSICWVCREMICRGDECVSFGWCFWHRACYSCLLCGSRAVQGLAIRGEGGATEVFEPPLCVNCDMETAGERYWGDDDDGLVQACLEFVDSVDGGVAKLRRRMRRDEDEAVRDGRGEGGGTVVKLGMDRECVAEMAGSGGREFEMVDEGGVHAPGELIWVDTADPINGLTFCPHPLKPIPLCMTNRIAGLS